MRTQDQQTIIRYFIVEFAELVDTGQYGPDDNNILTLALEHTGTQDRERIVRDLLSAFRHSLVKRPLNANDKIILARLKEYAGDQVEECARLLTEAEGSSA